MNRLIAIYEKYREIITYLIAGGGTTVVSWGTYSAAVMLLPMHAGNLKVLLSNAISWVFAMLFAYITNKIWVFRSYNWKRSYVAAEFAKFASSRLATGLFEIVAVPLLVTLGLNQEIFGIEGMVSKVLVSIVVVVLNYILSKLLIFRDNR